MVLYPTNGSGRSRKKVLDRSNGESRWARGRTKGDGAVRLSGRGKEWAGRVRVEFGTCRWCLKVAMGWGLGGSGKIRNGRERVKGRWRWSRKWSKLRN